MPQRKKRQLHQSQQNSKSNQSIKSEIMKQKLRLLAPTLFVFIFTACDTSYYDSNYTYYPDMEMSENPTGENYKEYTENQFITTAEHPVSTFSVDADGGSYANMRRFMHLGQQPPKAAVRIEEFLNYFTFDYANPTGDENVALNSEISECPWNTSHHLLRVGMKGKSIPESELPNSNFVFLIDVSGSMSSPEKLPVLKTGFKMMVDQMRDRDRVAIVTYAGEASVLLESTYGDEKTKIKNAIEKLGAGGSTAGAKGILTAYDIAEKNLIPGGNNRIIIGSDGDFNVGPSTTDELVKLVEEKRDGGIYLTTLGVGTGNLNDHMMEQIANKGNGNYEYIDSADELMKVFVNEKSKFYTVAKDSKIQITFNPDKVLKYRLIGYENRSLNQEDFENDSTDAGEIGAGQTITALYELELTNSVTADAMPYAQFDFRYKKPTETESRLIQHSVTGNPVAAVSASENMRFAISLSAFGLILRESEFKGTADKTMILNFAENAKTFDPHGYRTQFIGIVNKWKP
jgi:Ca-activated chloride channel family protein